MGKLDIIFITIAFGKLHVITSLTASDDINLIMLIGFIHIHVTLSATLTIWFGGSIRGDNTTNTDRKFETVLTKSLTHMAWGGIQFEALNSWAVGYQVHGRVKSELRLR